MCEEACRVLAENFYLNTPRTTYSDRNFVPSQDLSKWVQKLVEGRGSGEKQPRYARTNLIRSVININMCTQLQKLGRVSLEVDSWSGGGLVGAV